MKQLNESFQSQEIKDIIKNNDFFKYYIPEPFFEPPKLSNLTVFGEKHGNILYYNIHYTIVKLYHTYLKLFNEEIQDEFINTNTTTYFTKVIQLFKPQQYNKKQNTNLNESDRVKIYRDINVYVKQLYSLLQQVVNHSNYESTAINFLFNKNILYNVRHNDSYYFNFLARTNDIPTHLTKYDSITMNELTNDFSNNDFDIAFFYNNNKLIGIFNKSGILYTDIDYLKNFYKNIYDKLISTIKNIKIDILTTLDNYNILYLTKLKTLFNIIKIGDIKKIIYNSDGLSKNTIAYQIGYIHNIQYDYALCSFNPKNTIRNYNSYYHYRKRNNISSRYTPSDYKKDPEFISTIGYKHMTLFRNPISLGDNIEFCKQCNNDYEDRTSGEIVHELLNILDTVYSNYSFILNNYKFIYNRTQNKKKELYDFNNAQKYVKYIGMYRNILEPFVQQVVDIMYRIKHNISIDKKLLEDSDINKERRDIENLTMELDKYRARLLRFKHTVWSNIKIK